MNDDVNGHDLGTSSDQGKVSINGLLGLLLEKKGPFKNTLKLNENVMRGNEAKFVAEQRRNDIGERTSSCQKTRYEDIRIQYNLGHEGPCSIETVLFRTSEMAWETSRSISSSER